VLTVAGIKASRGRQSAGVPFPSLGLSSPSSVVGYAHRHQRTVV